MSAYVIFEFTILDPTVAKEKYSPLAPATVKEHGGTAIANSAWETLWGDERLTSGAILEFPDREAALAWYSSPQYQALVADRNVAMDARLSLLEGLPAVPSA